MQTIACQEPLLEAGLGDSLFELVDAGTGLGACDDHVFGRDVELLFDGCCLAGLWVYFTNRHSGSKRA